MDRPNSALKVPYKNLMEFFTLWLKFLRPFHTLSDRELEVAACMLKNRYELSKKISDEKILNDVLFSKENKDKMLKELHITNQYYQVILGKLRKVKFIKDNKIYSRFIPEYEEGKMFTLLLIFDEEKIKNEL